MTRKDFILIAQALKEGTTYAVYKRSESAVSQHALMCNGMATRLSETNPRFNRTTFLKACGLSDDTIEAL